MKKKKNKNDLVIKTKQRILRETKSSQKEYITTYKDIKRYFRVFNKTLFKGKLNAFNDIQIKNMKTAYGQCVENLSYRKGNSLFFSFKPKFKKIGLELTL